jgi:hypothetical protein
VFPFGSNGLPGQNLLRIARCGGNAAKSRG